MDIYYTKVKQNRREVIVIMFDIAGWVANILILGLGIFFWVISLGILAYVLTGLIDKVLEYRYDS